MENLLRVIGVMQMTVLVASALVPIRLNWRQQFQSLPKLHRQMYWVYGGYVVLGIVALGTITLVNAAELAQGSLLARCFCGYAAAFWGIRLCLQTWLDVRDRLTTWWLMVGYHTLTVLFVCFTATYVYTALR